MLNANLSKYSVIIFVSAALISCSKNDGNNNQLVDQNKVGASCNYLPDQGEKFQVFLLGSQDIQTAAFNKKYNASMLTAVQNASAKWTYDYLKQNYIQVYAAESLGKGCDFFSFIPDSVPSYLTSFWSDSTSKDSEKERTLGLYVDYTQLPEIQSLDDKQVIIVRKNAARWTLVHEMMHANFARQSIKANYFVAKEKQDIKALAEDYSKAAAKNSTNSTDVINQAKLLIKLVSKMDAFLVNFTLEEIAIENLLANLYKSGKLTNVDASEYENSKWYINKSKNKYSEIMDNMKPALILTEAQLTAYANKEKEYSEVLPQTIAIRNLISARQEEIKDIAKEHPYIDKKTNLSRTLRMQTEHSEHSGCSHSHDVDFMKDLF